MVTKLEPGVAARARMRALRRSSLTTIYADHFLFCTKTHKPATKPEKRVDQWFFFWSIFKNEILMITRLDVRNLACPNMRRGSKRGAALFMFRHHPAGYYLVRSA